jgi:hypothetical protein
MVKNP